MFELREITDVFLYFRSYLVFIAMSAYLIAFNRRTSFWINQALGVQALVVVLSIFNILLLSQQLGPKAMWDAAILSLSAVLFQKIVKWKNTSKKHVDLYMSSFLHISFWLFGLPYLVFFPLILKPLE